MLGKIEGKRRGLLLLRWIDGMTDLTHMNIIKLTDSGGQRSRAWCCSPRGHRVGHDLATEQQEQIKRPIDSLQRTKVQIALID